MILFKKISTMILTVTTSLVVSGNVNAQDSESIPKKLYTDTLESVSENNERIYRRVIMKESLRAFDEVVMITNQNNYKLPDFLHEDYELEKSKSRIRAVIAKKGDRIYLYNEQKNLVTSTSLDNFIEKSRNASDALNQFKWERVKNRVALDFSAGAVVAGVYGAHVALLGGEWTSMFYWGAATVVLAELANAGNTNARLENSIFETTARSLFETLRRSSKKGDKLIEISANGMLSTEGMNLSRALAVLIGARKPSSGAKVMGMLSRNKCASFAKVSKK